MASRRERIRMTGPEVVDFLAAERTMSVATLGPGGRPHLVPLWYVPAGQVLSTWTYGSSQKVANLRRDPRATVLVEAGESYEELRGVSMECEVAVIDPGVDEDAEDAVVAIGSAVLRRYSGSDEAATAAAEFIRAQAAKRVGLVFTPTRTASWDHRKLGGGY